MGRTALQALAAGEIDLALGTFHATLPAEFEAVHLFDETFVVVARRGHPGLRQGLDLERYLALDHILVSFSGGLTGFSDMALKRLRRSRRVVASLPVFLASFAAVAAGDIIATVPARLAPAYAEPFGLSMYAPPLPIRAFSVAAVRHVRSRGDPGLDWVIERILALAKNAKPANPRARQAPRRGKRASA